MNRTSTTQLDAEVGEYGVVTKPGTIRFERVFPGPVERIWSYLTEPDKLAKWLAVGSTEQRMGGVVELTWQHDQLSPRREATPERFKKYQGAVTRWRITRHEPLRALGVIWDEGTDGESEVTFELTPRGNEVRLVITHERVADRETLLNVASGWHTHLAILGDNLEERVPRPFWSTHTALHAEYDQRLND